MHSNLLFARIKNVFLIMFVLFLAMESELHAQTLQDKIANKQQLTNLPTIYLTVPDAEGKDINSVLTKTGNVAEYHTAAIQVVDKTGKLEEFTDNKLEIKVRGNSTAQDSKRPYRLKFGKDIKDAEGNVIETHKHDMLGLGYAKRNWTLLTNHKDKSLLHNALTYHVGQAVGMDFCPGYKFVDLVINGEYRGNYQLSDHVEVGSHRVDVDEDTGWFIEAARGDMVEEPLVEAAGLRMSIKNPEPADEAETTALKAAVSDYFARLNHFWGIYSTPCSEEEFLNPKTGWRAYIDEESLAKFYIGINLTDDYDGFMTVKMYREADGKLKFGPLWDKDLAYGNWQNHGKLCEEYQPGYTFCDHMAKMMTDPYFVKKVHDKLHSIIDKGFVSDMQTKIQKIGTTLAESQKLNQSKWWTCDDYPGALKELSDYIEEHTAFFVDAIDKKYEAMGCDSLLEWSNENNEETGGDNDGDDTPTGQYEATIGEWNNIPLPATAIHPRATAAHLVVMGTSFFRLLNSNDDNDYIDAYSFAYNGANMSGKEFDINDEETLNKAKSGTLYLRCGGGAATVTITCIVPDPPITPDEEEDNTDQPATHQQLTNLPTIYLDAETIGDDWTQAAIEVFDQEDKLNQGVEWKKDGVSKKGNPLISVQFQGSGNAGTKSSYRLKFTDKIGLMPSGSFKQWVLSSNDDDPSMINNALAKELGDAVGLPYTPGYQFVDLYVNNEYMGTYQLTDRVKAEAGRSLVTGGKNDFDWQIQFDDKTEIKENSNAVYIDRIEAAPKIVIKNPDPKDITAEALATLKDEMTTYFTTFFGDNYTNVKANADQQQLIDWYICQEILSVYKGFSSVEAYRSVTEGATDHLLHFGPLWDSEKAFGNTGEAPAIDMSDLNSNGSHKGLMIEYAAHKMMKIFFNALWTQDWFKQGVITKWTALKEANLFSTLKQKSTTISATLAQSQPKNEEKWEDSLGKYNKYSEAVNAIGSYLDLRFEYLDKKFNELATEEVTILTLINAIEQLKAGELTPADIEAIVNKILKK